MVIYIGSDHRGFKLKEFLKQYISGTGYEVVDMGNAEYQEGDDYPDFAARVAKQVSLDPDHTRGIVICASGVGVDIVANKFSRVRSALAATPEQASASRNDDDTNVLALAAEYLEEEQAKNLVSVWMQTPFSGDERHARRLKKIEQIELER